MRWLALGRGAGVVLAYVPSTSTAPIPAAAHAFTPTCLPLEHALLCLASRPVSRRRSWRCRSRSWAFLCTRVFSHRALAEREGGRPMFEPALLDASGISRGSSASTPITASTSDTNRSSTMRPAGWWLPAGAATRTTALCGRSWAGRTAYRYRFEPFATRARRAIEPRSSRSGTSWRFEAEAEWPLLALDGGWARPEHTARLCFGGPRLATVAGRRGPGRRPRSRCGALAQQPTMFESVSSGRRARRFVARLRVDGVGGSGPTDESTAAGGWRPRVSGSRRAPSPAWSRPSEGDSLLDYVELEIAVAGTPLARLSARGERPLRGPRRTGKRR